jgi:tetrapyrrole methylase family protein/MazG family protein
MSSSDAGQRFLELLAVMTRLRGESGCPWDREQTRDSLRPFLVEETYEVLDALDTGDAARIREELGDLLFQVVFHTELARERGEFTMAELLDALVAKMTRRHPHVFGDRPVGSAAEALAQWEAIKASEGKRARSALEGVPRGLPALHHAQRVQHKAARVGFDWLGDLLFAVVNVARLANVDPEGALQAAVKRFGRRFESMEDAARDEGRGLHGRSLDDLERLWVQAKSRERPS